MASTTPSRERAPAAASLGRAAATAVLGAAVAVAVVHLVFAALGASLVVEPPGQAASEVGVLWAATLAAIVTALGSGVAALLARRAARPDRAFLVAVVVVLVVFAANPVVAADEALTVVALELEHLAAVAVALAVWLPVLRAHRR